MHRPAGVATGAAAERQRDRWRGSAASRGYDRTWQRLRLVVLAEEPLCRFCQQRGELVEATVIDHIVPIAVRPELRLDRSNLRALCKPCHDAHTGRRGGGRDGEAAG